MIKKISVHKVGNKLDDESIVFSKAPTSLDENLEKLLSNYFLSAFKPEEFYRLNNDIDITLNEVYACVTAIFNDPNVLQQQSENLAKHLYNQSMHPKIKGGEFCVTYMTDCDLNGKNFDAIGLFKSENKDTFLEVEHINDGFDIESRQGININKLDKGCLIFNTEKENGYVLSIVDNTNKGNEARYWKDDFLNVSVINNEFHQTNEFLSLAKNFVTNKLEENFEVNKADKIDLLNRSVDYFKTHEQFNKDEFEAEVFHHPKIIESFKEFDQNYREERELTPQEDFTISEQAVKKQARALKSVLKLDKNFHIYIHGDRELIEPGVDEKGRKFYKIYYNSET